MKGCLENYKPRTRVFEVLGFNLVLRGLTQEGEGTSAGLCGVLVHPGHNYVGRCM